MSALRLGGTRTSPAARSESRLLAAVVGVAACLLAGVETGESRGLDAVDGNTCNEGVVRVSVL